MTLAGAQVLSDRERKGTEAFLQATAAARALTDAIAAARVFGVILMVEEVRPESDDAATPEYRVYVVDPLSMNVDDVDC
jgi:hypothetical protein